MRRSLQRARRTLLCGAACGCALPVVAEHARDYTPRKKMHLDKYLVFGK